MSERILARHPEGKEGTRIDRGKYEQIRDAIVATIEREGEVGFQDLVSRVGSMLRGRFEGSIPWYVTTVKLDLEAREVIERVPGSRPQKLRTASGRRSVKAR